jgi:hypothetical protein
MSIHLPNSLHEAVKRLAAQDTISTDQFVTLAVAEKVSALMTLYWVEKRGGRTPTAARYAELIAKAPDIEPKADDF